MTLSRCRPPRSLLLALLPGLWLLGAGCGEDGGNPPATSATRPATLEDWKQQREAADEEVWADEKLAEEYERTLVGLWDALLAVQEQDAAQTATVLGGIDFERLLIGSPTPDAKLDHGIDRSISWTPRASAAWSSRARSTWSGRRNGTSAATPAPR